MYLHTNEKGEKFLCQKVLHFEELSTEAKEKAIQKYRGGSFDYDWWEYVYEDAKTIGSLMGIDIDKIYFSGFWSQGDGACFEGDYSYRKASVKAVKEYAPQDETLHEIVTSLFEVQKKRNYAISARIKHNGHYYHENCTSIDVWSNTNSRNLDDKEEEQISSVLRSFMNWIYFQLRKEYEAITSDETITETLTQEDILFSLDGSKIFYI